MPMPRNVFVGMSGGVDSSVTAALLKNQGYNVVGVYMKNWTQDVGGFECPWREDFEDAKRTATKLKINFLVFDFQKEYKQKVVGYMIAEYKAGRTPNPDVMCNQEVKFRLFLDSAMEKGADFIATGHYAKTKSGKLYVAENKSKDQTYFLYRITEQALSKTLFPIGDFKTKEEVRKLAKRFALPTADKKDSQGICFVGEVGIKDFLSEYVDTEPGPIIDQAGKEIGEHDGAIFYTIGQRHGLNVGGGLPYYVTKKDMKKNIVYVTTDLSDKNLWSKEIKLEEIHWINSQTTNYELLTTMRLKARLRYRGPLVSCKLEGDKLILDDEQRAISAGQSAVIYDGDHCLGGGIIK